MASAGARDVIDDIVELPRVNATGLDEPYLDRWAAPLGVDDLPARARREAGSHN